MEIFLVNHHKSYALEMSKLSSNPTIKNALGLTDKQSTEEGTGEFIDFVLEEERKGLQFSRVILNEYNNLIGIITLKNIDKHERTCHMGTWIGYDYWGKGYNALAKKDMLFMAFTKLDLELVFTGAKLSNTRSIKAQEKLPYIKTGVETEYPEAFKVLKALVKSPCILNVVEKDIFLDWHLKNNKKSFELFNYN